MAETVKDYSGACWNALIEEETKESIARLYIDSLDVSRAEKAAVAALAEALQLVRGIIKDAAMEGFNYQYGDWADRLFRSQADTDAVLAKYAASPRDAT